MYENWLTFELIDWIINQLVYGCSMKDILGKYKLQSASLEKVEQPSLDLQVPKYLLFS